jgi:hypothetical protein
MSSDDTAFCGRCGEQHRGDHACSIGTDELDPDRFCTRCGRRLDVQVFPMTVRATCRACDGVHPARPGWPPRPR